MKLIRLFCCKIIIKAIGDAMITYEIRPGLVGVRVFVLYTIVLFTLLI
jgi:hypothetical protein